MATTTPPMGLIGFLFDSSLESTPAADCQSICEMAEEIRRRILLAFAQMTICPDTAIEIDGEKWAPDKVWKALQDLYDWTHRACRKEEPTAVAFISSAYSCGQRQC